MSINIYFLLTLFFVFFLFMAFFLFDKFQRTKTYLFWLTSLISNNRGIRSFKLMNETLITGSFIFLSVFVSVVAYRWTRQMWLNISSRSKTPFGHGKQQILLRDFIFTMIDGLESSWSIFKGNTLYPVNCCNCREEFLSQWSMDWNGLFLFQGQYIVPSELL